jgi:hypothetical protein
MSPSLLLLPSSTSTYSKRVPPPRSRCFASPSSVPFPPRARHSIRLVRAAEQEQPNGAASGGDATANPINNGLVSMVALYLYSIISILHSLGF